MNILLSGSIRDGSLYNVISLILIFAFVLLLAYLAAKLTAKLQGNPLNKKANIKIIDSLRLGGNKYISIIKIGTNYYALAFGKDEITLIDKIDKDTISIPDNLKTDSDNINNNADESAFVNDADSKITDRNVTDSEEKKNFKDILISNINKNK
ncbi:MAG: flagellar biosynthetic protein FliO [Lachnospiraceae bacterium]|nr:flagellar biosynthetic protein FliO [Lachnospiraceae bacterium]MBQ8166642.1 flagellar biosynthetic protein FliO [Lachnospiraceae bacterium]